ncbi:MAG: hypothetical protein R2715_17685 [Ilumatobacteraceae bacterium]
MAAMDRELRNGIAGREPARFAPDELAVAVEEGEFGGLHTEGQDPIEQPQPVEDRHRVGQQVDADPQRTELGDRLVDLDLDAPFVQRHRGRQPADASAGDDRSHPLVRSVS